MNASIHARTSKKAGVGAPRTSTVGIGAGIGAGSGPDPPSQPESGWTRHASWSAATFGMSASSKSCVRRRTIASVVWERKTPVIPRGTSPSHAGPATRKLPPAVPLVRGDT